MLKNTDLRLGNLVNFTLESEKSFLQGKITALGINKCVIEVVGHKYKYAIKYKNVIPISLNERWMLNFDFILVGYKFISDDKRFNRIYIEIKQDSNFVFCNKNGTLKVLDYVHNFQNFFFALTGVELKLSFNFA